MRRWIVAALLAAVAVLAVPSAASAAEYYFDVSCGLTADSAPSHVCEIDDPIGAFFEADEDTEYEVCVEFPDESFICTEEQFAEANVLYVNRITTNQLGLHFATWWVGEELVGFWDFDVVEPPRPPAPTPSPTPAPAPPPPPTVAPPGPRISAACVKARRSVTRTKARLRKARQRKGAGKRMARLRTQLKKGKTAVKRAC